MENTELSKALCLFFREVAEREKKKAIASDDYVTAFVAAVIEEMLRETYTKFSVPRNIQFL